jgi:Fe2+ or Zn2+ uptake regulation protein
MPQTGATYLTIQKRIVMDAVKGMPTLFTARDLCDALAANRPRVSRATVYRVIAILRNEGSIREVWFPSGKRICINSDEPLVCIVECADCGDLRYESTERFSTLLANVGEQHVLHATVHQRVSCRCVESTDNAFSQARIKRRQELRNRNDSPTITKGVSPSKDVCAAQSRKCH